MPIPILAVVGPTASGKTGLAVALAHRLCGEVVSADSMQIYKGLSIGTAKPTEEEMEGVPHHLIDFLPPDAPFSVADYLESAHAAIERICAQGHTPILCGGTGLYLSSLLDDLKLSESEADPIYRATLSKRAEREGAEAIWQELHAVDPETAASLHPNNMGRVIRALEVYHQTGVTMTEHRRRSRLEPSRYDPCIVGLSYEDRARLYARIDRRVDQMLADGLLEEARSFYAAYGDPTVAPTASQAIGYKELWPYLAGTCTLEEAVEHLKRQTRRYAKRQLTWFRRDERVHWFDPDRYETLDALADAVAELWKHHLTGDHTHDLT